MAIRPPHYPSVGELEHTEEFQLEVSRGLIGGHSVVNIFGFNDAVGTTFIPLWESNTAYTYLTSAQNLQITSTAPDNGKTVLIVGLDANYDVITEAVVLSSTGSPLTTNLFLRVNTVIMTLGTNTGAVNVLAGAQLVARIRAGDGKNQATIYTVPNEHSFYLYRIDAFSATGNANQFITFQNRAVLPSGVTLNVAQTTFDNNMSIQRRLPFKYEGKTDIEFQARSSNNTNFVGIFGEGILIKDTI